MNGETFEAIGTIMLLFIMVIFVIAAIAVFINYLNISKTTARKIEIIGYLLLIGALMWGYVLKNIDLNKFYNDDWTFLNEKLKIIYTFLNDILTNNTSNAGKFSDIFFEDTSSYVEIQLLTVDIIEAILQISSTICIAIGRFYEIKQSNQKKDIQNKEIVKVKIKKRSLTNHAN